MTAARSRTLANRPAFWPVSVSLIVAAVIAASVPWRIAGGNVWFQIVWLTISAVAGLITGIEIEFDDQSTFAKDRSMSPNAWIIALLVAFGSIFGVLWLAISFQLVGHNHSAVWIVLWIGSLVWAVSAFTGVQCAFNKNVCRYL